MTSLVSASSLVSVTAAAFAVAALCQLSKFLLDYIVKPSNANHANFVRLYVYALAAAVVVLYSSANTAVVFTGQFVTGVLTAVLTVGSGAILQYNLLNGLSTTPGLITAGTLSTASDLPTQTPPTPTVAAVPVTPAPVEAASTPASDPAQRI